MAISNFIAGAILLLFGILIRAFNLSGLIAGYNTASKAEKAKVNERALTRFVGGALIAAGAALTAGGLFAAFGIAPVFFVAASWALFLALVVFMLIYVNTSPKMKNKG